MRGPHRPDIETPSWRKFVPIEDTTNDTDCSDDDTTAEAYIHRYHQFSVEERSRWAPKTVTNPSTPNATPRSRSHSASKRNKPFFPIPAEAFRLVRTALNAFKEKNNIQPPQNSMLSEQTQVLELLEPTLTCYAEVEDKLRSAKMRIKAAVNAHAYHTGATEARAHDLGKRAIPEFTLLYPFTFNSLMYTDPSAPISLSLNQCNGRLDPSPNRSVSQPPTPPLPTNASSLLTKEAVAMFNKHAHSKADLMEEVFRIETSPMIEMLKSLARQAQIPVPDSASFQVISAEITRRIRSQRDSSNDENRSSSQRKRSNANKLQKLIRQEIDAVRYPLLAQSFELDPEYCLDGARRSIESFIRGMCNGPEPSENDKKPWDCLPALESHISDEHTRHERKPYAADIIESSARQGPSGSVDGNGFGLGTAETKRVTSFENDNDLMLAPSTFQASRLDARRKLRQNVKRKLPRIHKERRNRKAFRFRDSAELISSGSSGASSSSPLWNTFREDATEATGMARRPSVTVQFQQVVDLDDKEDGTEPSVVYLDDEG